MRLNKVILSVISYIVVGSFQIVVLGQTISGKIIDSEQRPIEGIPFNRKLPLILHSINCPSSVFTWYQLPVFLITNPCTCFLFFKRS